MSLSTTSKKRRREQEVTPSVDNLQKMMDLSFDRTMIDSLIQSHAKDGSPDAAEPDAVASKNTMYCCPRAYENNFLREPVGSERICARGKSCEALQLDVDSPFILREFIYPGTEPSDMRSICLLCRRYEISLAFYTHETGHSHSASGQVRVSDHYNLVGVPGEYDVRDCIVSEATGSGLPLPVVLHSRTAYSVETIDGIKHLAQTRMRYPGGTELERGPFLTRRAGLADVKLAPSNCQDSHESS